MKPTLPATAASRRTRRQAQRPSRLLWFAASQADEVDCVPAWRLRTTTVPSHFPLCAFRSAPGRGRWDLRLFRTRRLAPATTDLLVPAIATAPALPDGAESRGQAGSPYRIPDPWPCEWS